MSDAESAGPEVRMGYMKELIQNLESTGGCMKDLMAIVESINREIDDSLLERQEAYDEIDRLRAENAALRRKLKKFQEQARAAINHDRIAEK